MDIPKIRVYKESYRKPCDDYFEYVFYTKPTCRHVSPFTLIKERKQAITIQSITHLNILQEKANDDDIIFHAWPGERNTDIFTYKYSELKEAYSKCDKWWIKKFPPLD